MSRNQKLKAPMRGAEAVLKKEMVLGRAILVKERMPKSYRIKELDEKLRKERTKQEARLLHRAKLTGVRCPVVLFVDEFSIGMGKIRGKRPKMSREECEKAGEMLAKLHSAGIIHGDFTPANLIKSKNELFVIDFGLGFFSEDVEDRAVDVLTMLKSIKDGKSFLRGYASAFGGCKKVEERIAEIRKRVRYA